MYLSQIQLFQISSHWNNPIMNVCRHVSRDPSALGSFVGPQPLISCTNKSWDLGGWDPVRGNKILEGFETKKLLSSRILCTCHTCALWVEIALLTIKSTRVALAKQPSVYLVTVATATFTCGEWCCVELPLSVFLSFRKGTFWRTGQPIPNSHAPNLASQPDSLYSHAFWQLN
jgi:hypothetical protein